MSGKRVILDADILSMFAKVDAIEVLGEFLGRGRVGMTPRASYISASYPARVVVEWDAK